MSIQSAIQAAQGRVSAAYDAIVEKGGERPTTENLAALPDAIAALPSGGEKMEVLSISFPSFTCYGQTIWTFPKNIDTSKVVTMASMFKDFCVYTYKTGYLDLDLRNINTSNVTTFESMFRYGYSTRKYDLSSFDTTKVTSTAAMFAQCYNSYILRYFPDDCYAIVVFGEKWSVSVDLSAMTFSHDSLVETLNTLPTITSVKTITIGSTNMALLNDTEISSITAKGWTLA